MCSAILFSLRGKLSLQGERGLRAQVHKYGTTRVISISTSAMDQKWLTLCWKRRWRWRGGVLVRLISELREQFISMLIPHKGHHFQRLITISNIIKPNAIQITQPLQMRFLNCICSSSSWGFGGSNGPPPWLHGKEYACKAGDKVSIPGQEDPLEEEMQPTPGFLLGNPTEEETARLQSLGSEALNTNELLNYNKGVTQQSTSRRTTNTKLGYLWCGSQPNTVDEGTF